MCRLSDDGQSAVILWSSYGQISVKPWSNAGQMPLCAHIYLRPEKSSIITWTQGELQSVDYSTQISHSCINQFLTVSRTGQRFVSHKWSQSWTRKEIWLISRSYFQILVYPTQFRKDTGLRSLLQYPGKRFLFLN
jgi:hypothetical protein